MNRIVVLFLSIVLVGCASLPLPSKTGEGMLVVTSELNREASGGPWWNYQIWAKNVDTGDKAVIAINVNGSMKFHYSKPLAPGKYEIYSFNSVTQPKYKAQARNADVHGTFTIKPDTLTLYDHKIIVTITDEYQNFSFEKMPTDYQTEFKQELLSKEENAESWDTYWESTDRAGF